MTVAHVLVNGLPLSFHEIGDACGNMPQCFCIQVVQCARLHLTLQV